MARSTGTTKSGAKASAKSRKARAPKAPSTDGLPVLKSIEEVASGSKLGKAIAKVEHMKGGGPDATQYVGLTAKGKDGKPVYAIVKTGQRSGEGGTKSKHVCTLHTFDKDGNLSEPLAVVKSVRAGWVFPAKS